MENILERFFIVMLLLNENESNWDAARLAFRCVSAEK